VTARQVPKALAELLAAAACAHRQADKIARPRENSRAGSR
jgi:hypothetical protein